MLHYRLITASPDWSTLTCVKQAISRTSGTILNCTPKVGHKTNYYERV